MAGFMTLRLGKLGMLSEEADKFVEWLLLGGIFVGIFQWLKKVVVYANQGIGGLQVTENILIRSNVRGNISLARR